MADSIHSPSTCKLPLSALMQYYRRNLVGESARVLPASSVIERRYSVSVAVDGQLEGSVLAVAEFAAHVAYLEPVTGIGQLVAPRPDNDLVAPGDWFLDVAQSGGRDDCASTGGLSMQTAVRVHALKQLGRVGRQLLDNDEHTIESAGRTTAGHLAICLWAPRITGRPFVIEDLQRAVTGLHLVARSPA